jgi:DNA-directed RNA polymerase specialized sigma24 family protein
VYSDRPAAADDATQEALLAIFRGLPSLRAPQAIMTWVRSVTMRTVIRLARRHDLEVAAEGTQFAPLRLLSRRAGGH